MSIHSSVDDARTVVDEAVLLDGLNLRDVVARVVEHAVSVRLVVAQSAKEIVADLATIELFAVSKEKLRQVVIDVVAALAFD